MCGIVGYIGKRDAAPILMEGLHRLEYRGYDSAGIALRAQRQAQRLQEQGQGARAGAALPERLKGTTGIAHTRWATHGEPSDRNAHPHSDARERFAIVHNGIIENAAQLRAKLQAQRRDVPVRDRLGSARAPDRRHAGRHARGLGARRAAARHRHVRPRRARRAAARNDRRRAQRQPGDARHRRARDVRRLRSGRARAPHAERRASGRRRDRGGARRRLRDLDARRRRRPRRRRRRSPGPTSRSTRAATRTTCARRSPSSPKRSAAR